jgi:hypothetical protein
MGGGGHNKGQGFDGGGHETRVRGNAYQVLEKYLQLARDAGSAGDRVAAENYLQHADHYYRVLAAMNDGQRPRVGGRELSVADVNVQNVSQGLSAALSAGQGVSGMDGNQAQGDGQDDGQGQGDGDGQGQSDAQGQDRAHNQGGQGRNPQHGQQRGQGHNQNHGQNHGQNQNRSQGQHQPRHNQGHQPQRQPDAAGNVASNGHNGNFGGNYADMGEQPPVTYVPVAEPARAASQPVAEEQPDYPEELLPTTAAPAVEASAAPSAEPAEARAPRGPRGPSRGRGRRGPRTQDSAPGGTEPGE